MIAFNTIFYFVPYTIQNKKSGTIFGTTFLAILFKFISLVKP
ncbi:hypothetical protein N644_0361 [Lactiplantibacillus paraplantarum]|nr:hypothetical protein N644_0361 [Lactiplantibacillus paraplantarum]